MTNVRRACACVFTLGVFSRHRERRRCRLTSRHHRQRRFARRRLIRRSCERRLCARRCSRSPPNSHPFASGWHCAALLGACAGVVRRDVARRVARGGGRLACARRLRLCAGAGAGACAAVAIALRAHLRGAAICDACTRCRDGGAADLVCSITCSASRPLLGYRLAGADGGALPRSARIDSTHFFMCPLSCRFAAGTSPSREARRSSLHGPCRASLCAAASPSLSTAFTCAWETRPSTTSPPLASPPLARLGVSCPSGAACLVLPALYRPRSLLLLSPLARHAHAQAGT